MCSASGGEKSKAAKLDKFSDDLVSQAKTIFGNDSSVFNQMMKAYGDIVNAGVSQHGFNQAELNERQGAAITNVANQYRNVASAVKAGQAGFGGGDVPTNAGVTVGQNLTTAQAAAGEAASELNQINAEDYATGRENFFRAGAGEESLPSVFSNLPGVDAAAQTGLDKSLEEQKNLDAQAGWWKAPVMGLVKGGLSLATGGLSSVASGGSFLGGVGKSLDKMS